MSQHSSVPALKAALKAQLLALTAAGQPLAGVAINYGSPLPQPDREYVWLKDVAGDVEPAAIAAGTVPKEEQYTLTLEVSVLHDTLDQQSVTERAYALANAIYDQLQSDPTVGGTVRSALIAGKFRLDEFASDRTREACLTLPVRCRARI